MPAAQPPVWRLRDSALCYDANFVANPARLQDLASAVSIAEDAIHAQMGIRLQLDIKVDGEDGAEQQGIAPDERSWFFKEFADHADLVQKRAANDQ